MATPERFSYKDDHSHQEDDWDFDLSKVEGEAVFGSLEWLKTTKMELEDLERERHELRSRLIQIDKKYRKISEDIAPEVGASHEEINSFFYWRRLNRKFRKLNKWYSEAEEFYHKNEESRRKALREKAESRIVHPIDEDHKANDVIVVKPRAIKDRPDYLRVVDDDFIANKQVGRDAEEEDESESLKEKRKWLRDHSGPIEAPLTATGTKIDRDSSTQFPDKAVDEEEVLETEDKIDAKREEENKPFVAHRDISKIVDKAWPEYEDRKRRIKQAEKEINEIRESRARIILEEPVLNVKNDIENANEESADDTQELEPIDVKLDSGDESGKVETSEVLDEERYKEVDEESPRSEIKKGKIEIHYPKHDRKIGLRITTKEKPKEESVDMAEEAPQNKEEDRKEETDEESIKTKYSWNPNEAEELLRYIPSPKEISELDIERSKLTKKILKLDKVERGHIKGKKPKKKGFFGRIFDVTDMSDIDTLEAVKEAKVKLPKELSRLAKELDIKDDRFTRAHALFRKLERRHSELNKRGSLSNEESAELAQLNDYKSKLDGALRFGIGDFKEVQKEGFS